ncbi:Unknown protein, partial [Striga hermonthica]
DEKSACSQIKSLKMNVHQVDTDKDVEYLKNELQNMREINGKLNDQLTSSFTYEKEVELQFALARIVILENGLKSFKQTSSEKDQVIESLRTDLFSLQKIADNKDKEVGTLKGELSRVMNEHVNLRDRLAQCDKNLKEKSAELERTSQLLNKMNKGKADVDELLDLHKNQVGPEQTLVRSRVEEQTVTMTRDEMQRMIAEAVAAQLKQAQPEQPRVEPLRIEQPNIEREQQAQSNERQNRRAEEEASSIRTVNPQARDETLEQLLAQVRDLQAQVEGRKTGGSRGHPFSQHILDADLPQGFRDLNISYDGSTDPSRNMKSFENMA